MSFPSVIAMPLCYRDGMISSEELAVFDVQDVDPSYYYQQHIDQVKYCYYYCLWYCIPDVVIFTVC